jgi:hypothetical protein
MAGNINSATWRAKRLKPKRIRITSIAPIRRGRWPLERLRVARYRKMLRQGLKPPPLVLGERLPDGRWQLFDGRHRLRAATLEDRKMIEVFMMLGYA